MRNLPRVGGREQARSVCRGRAVRQSSGSTALLPGFELRLGYLVPLFAFECRDAELEGFSPGFAGPCIEVGNAIGGITVETAENPDADSTVWIVAVKRAYSQTILDRVSVLIEATRCGLSVHSRGAVKRRLGDRLRGHGPGRSRDRGNTGRRGRPTARRLLDRVETALGAGEHSLSVTVGIREIGIRPAAE